jgi:flagellin-like hook-associated protein FlgL
MDYDADNGFIVASGLVDAGKEHVATALEQFGKKHALGTSHGFVGLKSDDKYIIQYRMLEISPLPLENAANYGTHFGVSVKEIQDMAFTDARKTFLKDTMQVDDATIASWESHVDALGAKMKELGLAFKDAPEAAATDTAVATSTSAAVVVPAAAEQGTIVAAVPTAVVVIEPVAAVKADDTQVAVPNELAVALANVTDAVAQIASVLGTVVAEQKALKDSVAAVGRSQDDQVASFFTSKAAKLPKAFDPTDTPANVTGQKSQEDELSWFIDGVKAEA